MKITDFAKMARELVASRKENAELKAKLAAFEKKAEAEQILVEAMSDPRVPLHLRPSGVQDFLTKRAQIEGQDPKTVKLAMQMASGTEFGIGEPESSKPAFTSSGSLADDQFTEWLLGSQTT